MYILTTGLKSGCSNTYPLLLTINEYPFTPNYGKKNKIDKITFIWCTCSL